MKRLVKIGVPLAVLTLSLGYAWFVVLPGRGGNSPSISSPPLSGSFSVGRTSFDWNDSARQREIMVWVWYPTSQNAGRNSSRYLPGKWGDLASEWDARNINLRVMTQPFNLQKLWSALTFNPPLAAISIQQMHIHAIDNVQMAPVSTSYPVLLFSPGLGKMPTDYTAMIEDIVSHGYIVIGVNPTGYTPNTVFADGRQAGLMPPWEINPSAASMINIWVSDMVFALDQMANVNEDRQSPFYHHLNLSAVGAFGHSFGGAAAAGAAYRDPRIKAGIDMDGTPRGDRSTWKISKPFMLLQSDYSLQGPDPQADEFYRGLETGYLAKIAGALHRGFSDEVLYPLPDPGRKALVGTITGGRMVQITSAYARAFFDTYLLGQTSPLLTGTSSDYPEVSIAKR